MSILRANLYIKKVTDLTPYYLINKGITVLLIDLDNTIINPETNEIIPRVHEWIELLKNNDIMIRFVSNTSCSNKKKQLEKELGAPVIIRALKPLSVGIEKAVEQIDILKKQIAIIGDQTFTDVLGGNLYGLHTIRVNPISYTKEDSNLSKICRYLENIYFIAKAEKIRVMETFVEVDPKVYKKEI